MRKTIIILLSLCIYSYMYGCSFDIDPFCKTIHDKNPDNVVLRGYFSDDLSDGLVFTRLETLRGEEERDKINVWNNIPFDCNGTFERNASSMGAMDQEIIISLTLIDSLYSEYEVLGDYRVPDGVWWETHSLNVEDDMVMGYIFVIFNYTEVIIDYDEFIDKVIDNTQCLTTSVINRPKEKFNVYPTLVDEYINIEFNSENAQNKLYIYDAVGNQVISDQLSPTMYLGTLAKGMYIVMVVNKNNECYHQKIVKI